MLPGRLRIQRGPAPKRPPQAWCRRLEPSQEPSDEVARFDQYWKYDNGLEVSITSAGEGHRLRQKSMVLITVKIKNKAGQTWDADDSVCDFSFGPEALAQIDENSLHLCRLLGGESTRNRNPLLARSTITAFVVLITQVVYVALATTFSNFPLVGTPGRATRRPRLLAGQSAGSAVGADDVTSPEVGGGRRGLATAPNERGVLEHHRKGPHVMIVAGERGAVLDLQVQVR
jgi:hypothetical protein